MQPGNAAPMRLTQLPFCRQGRAVLEAIRGTQDVDAEYGTILKAYQREKGNGDNQFKTLMKRSLRPHLTMSIACPFFQQVHPKPSPDLKGREGGFETDHSCTCSCDYCAYLTSSVCAGLSSCDKLYAPVCNPSRLKL